MPRPSGSAQLRQDVISYLKAQFMPPEIEYFEDRKISAEQLSALFRSADMHRPMDDLCRLQRMLDNADIVISAFAGDHLVGIARAITDFSYCCYLSDLAVSADFQRQGIGKKLIQLVHQRIGPQCSLLLLSAPNAMSYYPLVNFEPVTNGWMIKRVE